MSDLIDLAKAEGGYQDIVIKGEKVFEGWRDCESRWKLIKPRIKGKTVLEIGSHYGYFIMQAAERYDTRMFWSIEGDPKRAEIQRTALEANDLNNVVLSERRFSLIDALNLERSCTMIDTVLMLSVAHYFGPKKLPHIINAISRISPRLIIEFPNKAERNVAEKEMVDKTEIEYLLHFAYDSVTKIGESSSPSHPEVMRSIYLCDNNMIQRENCKSHINAKHGKKHRVAYVNDQWHLDGRPLLLGGYNLSDMNLFNPIYPINLESRAIDAYESCILKHKGKVTDISTSNLIVGAGHMDVIDYQEGIGEPIYGKSWKEYSDWVSKLTRGGIREELRK